MEPEDGCLTIPGTDDLSNIGFTQDGLEYLQQLLENFKAERQNRGAVNLPHGAGRMLTLYF